jgi:ribosomal protein S18 acetylase RimI-like enzyme
MGDVTIRSAEPRDAEAIAAMTRRLRVDDPVEREPSAFAAYFDRPVPLDDPEVSVFVACGPDDVPVGYLAMRPESEYFTGERRAYIDHLAVAAHAEGRGIGRLLLAQAEAWARERGCAVLSLDVFAANDRARSLYGRSGFREDFVRMVRRLPDSD